MKLRYETGTATLTQLIVMLLLNFITNIDSTVTGCIHKDGCVSGIVINFTFVLVLAGWLMGLSGLGYMAQEKRSRRLATLLIAGEVLVVIVTLFNIRHYPNKLGLITSIVDCALAIWVITLAYHLRQTKESIVTAPRGDRPRRRLQR